MKKGVMWNQLIWWIVALIVLAVLFYPATGWAKNTWEKASNLFSWGDDDNGNDDPEKVEYYDTFNRALRDENIAYEYEYSLDDLTSIINNLKFEQKLDATTGDIYLLSSTHAGKTMYLLYHPNSEGINVLQKSGIKADDEKIYSYEESLKKGSLIQQSPLDLYEIKRNFLGIKYKEPYRLSPLTRADHQYSIDAGYPLPSTLREKVLEVVSEGEKK